LRTISTFAFFESGLESIGIPQPVEYLVDGCFQGCARLSGLTFARGSKFNVQWLGTRALGWCVSLQSISIPSQVQTINEDCFTDCEQLTTVTFEAGSKLSRIEQKAFFHCCRLGPSIELPSSLFFVSVSCFQGCEALSAIRFGPNPSVLEIRQKAFSGCSLRSFCIPCSVRAIDWTCFANCGQGTEITFESPARVDQILNFDPGKGVALVMPDSVEIVSVAADRDCGFVCEFGVDSKLRELRRGRYMRPGSGFMRISEASLKRIRNGNEWIARRF
jgi:hypothetical protein